VIKVFDGIYRDGMVKIDGKLDLQDLDIASIKVIFDLVEKPDLVEKKRLAMQEILNKVKNAPKRTPYGN
jgi:hypothetical protein